MYNRIYTGGSDDVRVPPDYSGSAIKPPAIPQTPSPPPEQPPQCDPVSREEDPASPVSSPCEKSGGYLGNLLSKISADDLIIYGIIIYMTLQDSESDLLLLILLLVVLI